MRTNLLSIRQQLEFNLICAKDATTSSPELVSYSDGKLVLSWETPSACETALEGGDDTTPPASEKTGGRGFLHFLSTMFWLSIVGLFLYFAFGEFRTHLVVTLADALLLQGSGTITRLTGPKVSIFCLTRSSGVTCRLWLGILPHIFRRVSGDQTAEGHEGDILPSSCQVKPCQHRIRPYGVRTWPCVLRESPRNWKT